LIYPQRDGDVTVEPLRQSGFCVCADTVQAGDHVYVRGSQHLTHPVQRKKNTVCFSKKKNVGISARTKSTAPILYIRVWGNKTVDTLACTKKKHPSRF
jgi:hypothetical protein